MLPFRIPPLRHTPARRLISFLHLIEGRSLGLLHLVLSGVGIYASWEDVSNRKNYIAVFAVGCFIWGIIDVIYLTFLLAASSDALRGAAVAFVSSNTFSNLAPSLDKLFQSLAADSNFLTIFSSTTEVFFDAMATYWSVMLYNDVCESLALSESRVPLLPPHTSPSRTNISGFSTISRPSVQPPARVMHPFTGRGFRLGAGESML